MAGRFEPRVEPTAQAPRTVDGLEVESSLPAEFSLEIRPELRPQIAGETEPECERPLEEPQASGIETIRIPHIGKESRTVSAAYTPGGQRFAAPVGAREDGSPERMCRAVPEASAVRSKVTRILMQRSIQAESERAVDSRPA